MQGKPFNLVNLKHGPLMVLLFLFAYAGHAALAGPACNKHLTSMQPASCLTYRYKRPSDSSFLQVYLAMQSATPDKLLTTFLKITKDMYHPVFHNFFLEAFRQPSAWFDARTTYTRATAVNSMAGYVIGLGDRHFGESVITHNYT